LKDYIKKDSFYAISRIIFELTLSGVTRREIAEKCNFSQMTVGKVVALLEAKGLVSQLRAETSKGRHAQLVIPSQKIRYLTVNTTDSEWTAYLTDFGGNVTLRKSAPLDPSMSYKDNFHNILRDLTYAAEPRDAAVFAAIVRHFSPEEDISDISLPTNCEYLLSTEHTELVKRHVSRRFRRYNSLYVGIFRSSCSLMIFEKSKLHAFSSFEISDLDADESKTQILHRTEELLSSISFLPDTLIFESEALTKVFAKSLYERVKDSLFEKLPSMCRSYEYENMRFSDEEALFELRKQTAHTVTDMFYNE
jgi:hypothetical protein